MRYFRHIRGKIIIEVVGSFLIGSGSAASWMISGRLALAVAAVVTLPYCVYRAISLLARDPALAFDKNEILVGRLFSVSRFKWQQLRDVRTAEWRIDDRIGGLLPSWLPLERQYVELQLEGAGIMSTLVKVRADLIELPPRGASELVELMRSTQIAALGSRQAAMMRLGVDAKEQAAAYTQPTGIQAERLKRLGLLNEAEPTELPAEDASPVAPVRFTPSRPAFGRKVS